MKPRLTIVGMSVNTCCRAVARTALGISLGVTLASCRSVGGEPSSTAPPGDTPLPGAPSSSPTPFKSELVICATHEPKRLLGSTDPTSAAIERALIRPAAKYGSGYGAQADLLSTLPSEADGTLKRNEDGTISVGLRYRKDLKWSDGEPFKTADAVLGFKTPSEDGINKVISVREGDALTVFLTLASGAEYPYVPEQAPLPSHKLAGIDPATLADSDYARLVNPTLGPYFVSEWQAGQHITLQANPNYSPAPAIQTVRFQIVGDSAQLPGLLSDGSCDAALNDSLTFDQYPALQQASEGGALRVAVRSGPVQDDLVFNTFIGTSGRVPYFADARVRQAVAFAFDRSALGTQLWQGVSPVLDSWLPPDHWAASIDGLTLYPTDPARAKALLDQAGWVDQNSDGLREYQGDGGAYTCQRGDWKIEKGVQLAPTLILPSGDPVRERIAEQLKTDLAQIGISVQIQPLDPASLFAADGPLVSRQFDLALLTSATRPDPGGINAWVGADVFRHPLDHTAVHRWQLEDRWLTSDQLVERLALSNVPSESNDFQGQNFSGWCNEQADTVIVEANLGLDVPSRTGLYVEHQKLFTADLPMLPLFMRPRLAATASVVCGLQPGPFDPLTWNLAEWYFDPGGQCAH